MTEPDDVALFRREPQRAVATLVQLNDAIARQRFGVGRVDASKLPARAALGMRAAPQGQPLLPAVDREHLPGDPAGTIGGEEEHTVRDVVRAAEPLERDTLDERALALVAV